MFQTLPRPTPETLAERLASLLGDLARAIAGHRPPDPAALPLLTAAWAWLRRRANRLASLLARFQAGTLRPPRQRPPKPPAAPAPSEAAAPLKPPPPKPPPQRLPRSAAWLLRRVPDTPVHASQLQQWLTDPALPAFLEAAPQAGRLLRPLCRALGVPIPEFLRLPPTPGQVARAAWTAACKAARAEEAWGRRLRRSLGLGARRPDDVLPVSPLEFLPPAFLPPAFLPPARPPPKRD